MSPNENRSDWSVFGAVALIALGVWLLLERLDNPVFAAVREALSFARGLLWPLLLIAAGIVILIVSRNGHLGSFRAKGARLYRSRTERMIGGVLGGLGAYLGVDPTWIRIGYIALGVLTGFPAIIVYIIGMIVIPEEPVGTVQQPMWPGNSTGTETVQTPPPAPPVPPAPTAPQPPSPPGQG